MARVAVFAGLVIDEAGNPVEISYIGGEPHYIVNNVGFLRHIRSEDVDRQVLGSIQTHVLANRDFMVKQIMDFMGQDDLFTKAAVDTSINNMDENINELFQIGLPEDTRTWLGMMGFRIVIDVHGDVVDVQMPEVTEFDED